jgi:hypothetical protein
MTVHTLYFVPLALSAAFLLWSFGPEVRASIKRDIAAWYVRHIKPIERPANDPLAKW